MDIAETKLAFAIAWLVASVAVLLVMLAPIALPARTIFHIAPECQRHRVGGTCPLCGMTRSFVLISHGDLRSARRANRYSLVVYFGFGLNECAVIGFSRRLVASLRRKLTRAGTTSSKRQEDGVYASA